MRRLLLLLPQVAVPPAAAASAGSVLLSLAAAARWATWQQRRQLHRGHLAVAGSSLRQHSHGMRSLLHVRCRRDGRRHGRGGVCRRLCLAAKVIDDRAIMLRLSRVLRQLVAVRCSGCVVLSSGRGAHQPAGGGARGGGEGGSAL